MIKFIFISILILPAISLCQSENLEENINLQNYLKLLFDSLGGIKGASTLATIAIIVQILMQTLRLNCIQTKLPKILGKHKFLIVYLLSTISGILALKLQGIDWLSSLLHSNTLAAYQVLIHQAIKQLKEKNIPSNTQN
jgi:membrane associated rhomboid family serine protease